MDRASFYEALYSLEGIEERYVAVCEHPRKGSEFHRVERFLSTWVSEEYLNHKCYYSVGLAADKPASGRGSREDIVALPTIWADIDFSEKGSKKPYPNEQQAMDALAEMPLKPSAIVRTGGGVHVYWFVTDRDADRVGEVELACRGWQGLYRKKLESIQEGITIDSTFDSSRILRIPDTVNKGRHVKVESLDGWRYEVSEIEQFLVARPAPVVLPNYGEGVDLGGPVDHVEFQIKMETLLANNRAAAAVWKHSKHLPSSSEYELSIAWYAVNSGWSDAEAAQLIILHRAKWEPLKIEKAKREDYLRKTIGLARRGWPGSVPPNIEDDVDRAEAVATAATPEDRSKALLDAFSGLIHIRVKKIVQYGREAESAKIVLEVEDGTRFPLGSFGAAVFDYRSVRKAVLATYGLLLPAMNQERWTNAIASTRPAWEVVEADELESVVVLKSLLEEYVYATPPSDKKDFEVMRSNHPIVRDGVIHVNVNGFATWLDRRKQKIARADIISTFRLMGLSPKSHTAAKSKGIVVCRSYWATPFIPIED